MLKMTFQLCSMRYSASMSLAQDSDLPTLDTRFIAFASQNRRLLQHYCLQISSSYGNVNDNR